MESADKMYSIWPKLRKRIFQYASLQSVKCDQLGLGDSEVDMSKFSDDELQTLAFSLLPIMFVGRKKNIRGRCTIHESLTSFIDMKPEGTNVELYLSQIEAKDRPQPLLLLIGGTRWNPNQSFVILERKAIECTSLLQAADICFKVTYILDIDYQPQCSAVWQPLQHLVYGISPGNLSSITLINFLTWLKNLPPSDES